MRRYHRSRQTLARIETLLNENGSDNINMVSAKIWLKSIDDYAAMNAVWDQLIYADGAPTRACGVVERVNPRDLVETAVP